MPFVERVVPAILSLPRESIARHEQSLLQAGGNYHRLGIGDNRHELGPVADHAAEIRQRYPGERIFCAVDFDNVIAGSLVTIPMAALRGDRRLRDLPTHLRQAAEVPQERLEALAGIVRNADKVVIWTSRLWTNHFGSHFPFWDEAATRHLKGQVGEIEVVTNKPAINPETQLLPWLRGSNPDRLIFIGSSNHDRKAAAAFQRSGVARQGVHFWDTGCWLI